MMEGVFVVVVKLMYLLMFGWDFLVLCLIEVEVKNGLVGKDVVVDCVCILLKMICVFVEKVVILNMVFVIVN